MSILEYILNFTGSLISNKFAVEIVIFLKDQSSIFPEKGIYPVTNVALFNALPLNKL